MSKLREYACGRQCQIRTPYCNSNIETTVLAHYRMAGLSGLGVKSPDLFGAWACSACHDYVDGRSHPNSDLIVRDLDHLQGVMRTLAVLVSEGIVTFPELKKRTVKLQKLVPRRT